MKKHSIHILILFFIAFFNVKVFSQEQFEQNPILFHRIVVTKDNFKDKGWEKNHATIDKTSVDDTKYIDIVNGPHTTDNTNGSAFLSRPTTADANLGNVRLRNNSFHGWRLSALTELKYSTYVSKKFKVNEPPPVPVAPVLILQVSLDGDYTFDSKLDGSINFFPQLQINDQPLPPPNEPPTGGILFVPAQAVKMNVWQKWDAFYGKWKFGATTETAVIPEFGQNGKLFYLKTFRDYYKDKGIDVRIVNGGGGAIRFTLPYFLDTYPEYKSYDDFEGYVDGFTLSTWSTDVRDGQSFTYDFEYIHTAFRYQKTILVTAIFLILASALFIFYRRKQIKAKVK